MDKLPNPHPGETLREDYLAPLGMSAYRLAKGLRMSQSAVSEILHGKRGISAMTALRLERLTGASARFWMGLQAAYDLEEARRQVEGNPALAADLDSIQRCDWVERDDGLFEILTPAHREEALPA